MRHRRPLVVAALALFSAAVLGLPGCGGVPLRTMIKMSSFDENDFAAIDPGAVRAALLLPDDVGVPAGSTLLRVKIGEGDEAPKHEIPLRTVRSGPEVGFGLPKAKRGRTWHLFDIAPADLAAFRAVQEAMSAAGGLDGEVGVEVSTGFENIELPRTMPIQIRLRLDRDDGFFTLYDGKFELPAVPLPPTAAPAPATVAPAAP